MSFSTSTTNATSGNYFGANNGGPFGSSGLQQQHQKTTTGLFGSGNTTATTANNGGITFGQTTQQPQGSGLFGNQASTANTGLFGHHAAATTTQAPPATTANTTMFNYAPQQQQQAMTTNTNDVQKTMLEYIITMKSQMDKLVPPTEPILHTGIACKGCGKSHILGVRYKCILCTDYDLCDQCEAKGMHSEHIFLKIKDTNKFNGFFPAFKQ